MGELELLRDVARAAAALLGAEDAYHSYMRPLAESPRDSWSAETVAELRRRATAGVARENELREALNRLATFAPHLFRTD